MGALVSDLHVYNRHVGLVNLMVVGNFTCQISSLNRLTTINHNVHQVNDLIFS